MLQRNEMSSTNTVLCTLSPVRVQWTSWMSGEGVTTNHSEGRTIQDMVRQMYSAKAVSVHFTTGGGGCWVMMEETGVGEGAKVSRSLWDGD